jgi:hypothetical protein
MYIHSPVKRQYVTDEHQHRLFLSESQCLTGGVNRQKASKYAHFHLYDLIMNDSFGLTGMNSNTKWLKSYNEFKEHNTAEC